jgi:hypothetical protein
MNTKKDYILKDWQLPNPIIAVFRNIEGIGFEFDKEAWDSIFSSNGHQLKTWGAESSSEAHFIGVKKQTPLHTDPRYPRYTWQLVLYCDDFCLVGMSGEETKVNAGTLFLLDTHSPHRLAKKSKDAEIYLAVSIDSKDIVEKDIVLPKLISYANSQDFSQFKRITK